VYGTVPPHARAMERYPKQFSRAARNRIDKGKCEAYRELQRDREAPPPEGEWYKDVVPQVDRTALMDYVFRVVFALAAEARKCVRQDLWTIARANEEIMRFAGAFAEETGNGEAGYDRRGQLIGSLTILNGYYQVLRPAVERELYKRPEWQAHLHDLRAIADERAKSAYSRSACADCRQSRS
jgi:hypothetical protein